MLTLYHHPYSQHVRRVTSLLEEAGIPYKPVHVSLDNGEHMSEAFMSINPNHQVPTLIDGSLKLHESNAILRYLCGKHNLRKWYPADASDAAVVDQWLDWNQSRLSQPVIDIVLNSVFLGDDADASAIENGKERMRELTKILSAALRDNDFLCGDTPTIADLSVASNISQLQLADAVPDDNSIKAWYGRVCEIPGFKKSLPS